MSADFWIQIVGYVLAIVAFCWTIISELKSRKITKSDALKTIINKIPEFVAEAEKIFGSKTGLAKNRYALNLAQTECIKSNILLTENITNQLSSQIEKILETPQKKSKEVKESV